MANRGKHTRNIAEVAPYGKHSKSETQSRYSIQTMIAGALIVIIAALAAFFIGRVFVILDSHAFADSTRSAFSTLRDTWVDEPIISFAESSDIVQAEQPSEASESLALPTERVDYTQHVSSMLQGGLMNGGCELVSLGVALDSMGLPSDIHEIVKNHLVIDGHFATGYSGDPYNRGAGYPAGIANAANSYLASVGSDKRAHDMTGISYDDLFTLVNLGYPVLVWTTMGCTEPEFAAAFDNGMEWYSNEHCVVMYGADSEYVKVSDPLEGMIVRNADTFASIYRECGSMALMIF